MSTIEDKNKLMEKPDSEDFDFKYASKKIMKGSSMHDYVTNSIYDDWCRFHFPNGVKEKIKDDEYYKVWFHYHDAADPMDSSCSYHIVYIEVCRQDIKEYLILKEKMDKAYVDYLKE